MISKELLSDIREIHSACGFMWMRMAVAKDAQDAFDVAKREFEDHEAAFKRIEMFLATHKWTGLMEGFIPPVNSDYSSTGTFDQGGPSLDNYRYKDAIQSTDATTTGIRSKSSDVTATDGAAKNDAASSNATTYATTTGSDATTNESRWTYANGRRNE